MRKLKEIVRKVKRQFENLPEEPKISIRRNECGLKRSTFNRAVKEDLNLRGYYLQHSQDIYAPTFSEADRVTFCQTIQEKCLIDPDFPKWIVHTDEAIFNRNGMTPVSIFYYDILFS